MKSVICCLVIILCFILLSRTAAANSNLAARSFAEAACSIALPESFRASPASWFRRAASRSEIRFAAWSPRNSIANPPTTRNQPIFSMWSFRAWSFLGNFLKCSTPSIITPIITIINPMAATNPQTLSHNASEELIQNYKRWREMRMIGMFAVESNAFQTQSLLLSGDVAITHGVFFSGAGRFEIL